MGGRQCQPGDNISFLVRRRLNGRYEDFRITSNSNEIPIGVCHKDDSLSRD